MNKITKMRKLHAVMIKYNNHIMTGERLSKTMTKVLKHKLPDSDKTIIEDYHQYRYKRLICIDNDYYYFKQL